MISAIDAEAEQGIFRELQRARADRITVVVSHRAWTLKGMDRIYVVDEGRIVEEGTYEQLLARGGRFAANLRRAALTTLTRRGRALPHHPWPGR